MTAGHTQLEPDTARATADAAVDAVGANAEPVHKGLAAFRQLNVRRCVEEFREPEEWSETDWACALAG